jgi:hypothetical protein
MFKINRSESGEGNHMPVVGVVRPGYERKSILFIKYIRTSHVGDCVNSATLHHHVFGGVFPPA